MSVPLSNVNQLTIHQLTNQLTCMERGGGSVITSERIPPHPFSPCEDGGRRGEVAHTEGGRVGPQRRGLTYLTFTISAGVNVWRESPGIGEVVFEGTREQPMPGKLRSEVGK